jgi:hypothetical protein
MLPHFCNVSRFKSLLFNSLQRDAIKVGFYFELVLMVRVDEFVPILEQIVGEY